MMDGTNGAIDFYMPVAREELLKMLEKAPEDPLICELLAKTLIFKRASLPIERLREEFLKPMGDIYLTLINAMKYTIAIKREVLRGLLELIKYSSENAKEDLIAAYIIVNRALHEITRMFCEIVLCELDSVDSSTAIELLADSMMDK